MAYEREREVAIRAVRAAARVCAAVRAELGAGSVLDKEDASPVTVADFASQAVINTFLAEAFPSDPVAGEEHSSALREAANAGLRAEVLARARAVLGAASDGAVLEAIDRSTFAGGAGRFWTVDPVDGTKGFVRGDHYVVALALIDHGAPVLGVLGCPTLALEPGAGEPGAGTLFVAVRGGGAFQASLAGGAERRIAVDSVSDPARARVCEPLERSHAAHDKAARVTARLGISRPPVLMDSQAKYAAVARGQASIYLRLVTRYQQKIWDHAAGVLLVEEAGGTVTDMHGEPMDFSRGRTLAANHGAIATNGRLHEVVLGAVRAELG